MFSCAKHRGEKPFKAGNISIGSCIQTMANFHCCFWLSWQNMVVKKIWWTSEWLGERRGNDKTLFKGVSLVTIFFF